MRTKSLIFTLNSLILFQSAHAGVSFQSLRKKAVTLYCSMSTKIITTLVLFAALLMTFGLQGAGHLRASYRKYQRLRVPAAPQPQPRPSHSQCPPRPYYSHKQLDHSNQSLRPVQPETSSFLSRLSDIDLQPFILYSILLLPRLRQEQYSKSLQSTNQTRESDRKPPPINSEHLPPVLRGTLLNSVPHLLDNGYDTVPPEILSIIAMFIHCGDFYLDCNLTVPAHYSDPLLLTGEGRDYSNPRRQVAIHFVDGDPNQLELAFSPRLYRDSEADRATYIDVITFNTNTLEQTTQKNVPNRSHRYGSPTSYLQNGIPYSSIPLIQQLGFIERDCCWYRKWSADGKHISCTDDYCINDQDPTSYLINRLPEGLQRKLSGGRTVGVQLDEQGIGIYEKATTKNDPSCALIHPTFDSIQKDNTGDTYYLVQAIPSKHLCSLALPYTPVQLQDSNGHPISGNDIANGDGSQAFLTDEYPDDIPSFAVGGNSTKTNTYCSIYKRRGEDLHEYPPELLWHQTSPLPQTAPTVFLYQDAYPAPMQWARYAYYRAKGSIVNPAENSVGRDKKLHKSLAAFALGAMAVSSTYGLLHHRPSRSSSHHSVP